MKTVKIAKTICIASLTVACIWGLAACGSGNSSNGKTGGVAAIVNGTEISEDKITEQVEAIRAQMSIDTEDAWGEWLAQNDYTPEKVREQIIDGYVDQELIRQGAAERGITVESSTVDEYVNSMKSQYDDDEAWQKALDGAGTTEEEYRQNLELSLLYTDLYAQFATDEEPSEEDLLKYSKMYATSYNGAKRSSHILFASDDEATAQEVLDKLNSGELDFADAAKQYSTDTASAEKGGDVGWDKLTSFVSEYQTALDGLEKDQMSGLVTSSFGIHIIKCTDVFNAPEEITSSDQLPSEFLDQIKKTISSSKQSEAYQTWLKEYKEAADIVINEMPEGLPYYVDMTKYQKEDDSAATDDSGLSATGTEGGSGEGDAAASGAAADGAAAGAAASGEGAASASEGSAGASAADTSAAGASSEGSSSSK